MNKILKSIIINKITKLAKKKFVIVKVTNERKMRKRNQNDIKTVHKRNTRDIKTKQKQSDHHHERECDKSL